MELWKRDARLGLIKLVDKGKLSAEDAAEEANRTVETFLKKKKELKK